jgi:hypothetical protein
MIFINNRFCTESLKLSLMCPTTKPNIILFSDRIDFGKRTMDVRHDEWLFVYNPTTRPVPLKVSLPNPVGPFFCEFVILNYYYNNNVNVSFYMLWNWRTGGNVYFSCYPIRLWTVNSYYIPTDHCRSTFHSYPNTRRRWVTLMLLRIILC